MNIHYSTHVASICELVETVATLSSCKDNKLHAKVQYTIKPTVSRWM